MAISFGKVALCLIDEVSDSYNKTMFHKTIEQEKTRCATPRCLVMKTVLT